MSSSQYTHHVPPPCTEEVKYIFADDHILVVEKPAGLLSVPGRFLKDCLLHRVWFEQPDAVVVHRLDLDTSGVMVLALSRLAVSELNRQFRERMVGKQYIADVWGQVSVPDGEIELPMRPDPDNRPKQVIDHEAGRPALTRFEVCSESDDRTRMTLKPVTGRSHQLRLHMAAIGHPILGCDLYAHRQAFEMSGRLLLHARKLSFTHPATGEAQEYVSDSIPWD